MNYKKGDKIKLLNDVVSGIVISFMDNRHLKILTDDGFEQIVKLNEIIHASHQQETKMEIVVALNTNADDGLFLAFTKAHERDDEKGLNLFLVNNTNYHVSFAYSFKHENYFVCKESGEVATHEILLLDCLTLQMLPEYSCVKLDAMFHSKMPFVAIPPVSEVIKLNLTKFYKPGFFANTQLLNTSSHVISLYKGATQSVKAENDFKDKVSELVKSKLEKKKGTVAKSHNYYQSLREMEVDLHLEEILDNTAGMTNGDKLTYQLNYFEEKLNEAIANNYIKITCIHGVGNGKLKSEVRKMLNDYNNVSYQDGSYEKHGFGATIIFIKHN